MSSADTPTGYPTSYGGSAASKRASTSSAARKKSLLSSARETSAAGGLENIASRTVGGGGSEGAVNVSGGPLSYEYTLSLARLHYGERDLQGSEHTIGNHAFPAEVPYFAADCYAFNAITLLLS